MDVHLPKGSFHLLNSEDVILKDRMKLSRVLWLKDDGIPRKEQSIITWLTTVLTSLPHNHSDPDIDMAWKTLDEVLRSYQLQQFLTDQPQDIIIKSTLVKVYLEEVNRLENFNNHTLTLLKIGSTLINNDRISSDLNKKFATFLQFSALWLTAIYKIDVCDDKTTKLVDEFVEMNLMKVKEKFSRHNNPKKALSVFLEQLFIPCIKLLTKWSIKKIPGFYLLDLLKSITKDLLFSRKNLDVFEKFFNVCGTVTQHSTTTEVKSEKVVDQLWEKIREGIRNDKNQTEWIAIIYGLLLSSFHRGSRSLKFRFYCKVVSCFENEDIFHDSKSHMTFSKLIEHNVQQNLYQPTVDPKSAQEQKEHYVDLFDKLLNNNISVNLGWSKCVCLIAKIDHHIVEPKLMDVLLKTLNQFQQNAVWLPEFFSDLVHNFTQIRKPVQLLKSYIQAIETVCKTKQESELFEVSSAFESALQSQCIAQCPFNTALDIWSEIQLNLGACVITNAKEQKVSSATLLNGRKHKVSDHEETRISKRPRLDPAHALFLPSLASLLSSVMEECDVLSIREQISTSHRMNTLLQEQVNIVLSLVDNVTDNYNENIMLTLLHLITAHENVLNLLKRYSIKGGSNSSSTESCWKTVMNLCESNKLALSAELGYNRWLCCIVRLLSWQQCEGDADRVYVEHTMDEFALRIVLYISKHLNGNTELETEWNKRTDVHKMKVQNFCESNFHILLQIPETHETIANIFLSSMDKNKDAVSESLFFGVVESVMKSPSFLECLSLHCVLVKKVLQSFAGLFKSGKGVSMLLHQLVDGSKSSLTNDEVSALIQDIHSKESPKKKQKKLVSRVKSMADVIQVISYVPSIPFELQESVLVILLSMISTMQTSGDYKHFPETVHKLILTNFDNLLASNSKLFHLIPIETLLHYLMQVDCCIEVKAIVNRLLVSCVHISSHDETFNKIVHKVCSYEEIPESVKVFLDITVCTLSTKVLNHMGILRRPVTENLFSIFHPVREVSVDRINSTKAMFQSCDADKSESMDGKVKLAIDVLVDILQNHKTHGILKSRSYSYLLSKFALNQVGRTEKSELDLLQCNAIQNTHDINNMDSLKCLLLSLEIKLHQQWKFVTDDKSWFAIMQQIMSLYSLSFVKTSPLYNLVVNRMVLIHMQMGDTEMHIKCWLADNLKSLQIQPTTSTIISQMSFINFISSLFDSKTKAFQTVKDFQGSAEELHLMQVNYLRDTFDISVGLLGNLTQSDPGDVDTQLCILSTLTNILNLGPTIIHLRLVTLIFHALARVELSEKNDLHRQLFSATYRAVNAVLLHHEVATINLVPLILSVCSKLLNFALIVGRQDNTLNNESALDTSLECTRLLDRLFQFIASEYGSYFKRCVPYTIAEFVTGESRDTLHTNVKKSLQNAMYHLMSLCDEYSVAMLRSTLPPGVRDVFRHLNSDFEKYFKYTGKV